MMESATSQPTSRHRLFQRPSVPKPLLRGWIHLGATPLALAASIVLTCLAPDTSTRWASAIFLACSLLLFGISALYHRLPWNETIHGILRRCDHSNIFLLIAGTYTPISIGILDPHSARVLLTVIWVGAALGIILSIGWPNAPRWLYVPIYIVLGWMAVFYMPSLSPTPGGSSCGCSSPGASATPWVPSSMASRSPTRGRKSLASTRSSTWGPSPAGCAARSPRISLFSATTKTGTSPYRAAIVATSGTAGTPRGALFVNQRRPYG